jgi:hypothetical protein
VSTAEVVDAGWHDTYFRWDISTPQRVVSRLGELPGQGDITKPGKKLYAERDRFGKWQHVLGPENVMLSYTIHARKKEVIRRLEVQAHLGESGEDDLCSPSSFESRFKRLQTFMAMIGVLPPEEPVCVRIDTAVDVGYRDTGEAQLVLEALRFARWPGQWYAEWQGPPPYTTVAIKKGRHTVGRVYCRNTKLRNGEPRWGKLRFESEHRFQWRQARPLDELRTERAAAVYWGAVFGQDRPAGNVTRIEREVQTMKLIERVQLGEITASQFEQLTGFVDAERLGLIDRVYKPETARRRRTLARELGVSPADAEVEPLDVNLDELLTIPRGAWAA